MTNPILPANPEESKLDIAETIRAAVDRDRPRQSDAFLKARAEVRGAILRAWAALVPDGEWTPVDDRIVDVVDRWLDAKGGRS